MASSWLLLMLTVVIVTMTTVRSACNPDIGPAGSYDCFASHYYDNKGQWGTCVNKDYLGRKSKGTYSCRNPLATYCYFQCMLEVHGLDSGNVTSDCACDPDNPVTPAPSEVTTLPPRCFSPDGTDCSWYRDCLEVKYQCASGEDDYGLKYGETFCELYSRHNHNNKLSSQAWEWVDNVRKCLLVELVPLLREFESNTSCADIKTLAFRSHLGCYVHPFKNTSSICDLSLKDYWKVFWTIRKRFHEDFVESVLRLLEVRRECRARYVRQVDAEMRSLLVRVNIPTHKLTKRSASGGPSSFELGYEAIEQNREQLARKLTEEELPRELSARKVPDSVPRGLSAGIVADFEPDLDKERPESNYGRFRRQALSGEEEWNTNSQALLYHQKAADVCEDFARQLHWAEKNVLWFTYGVYMGQGQLAVRILLADKNITITNTDGSSANLTAVLEETMEAFEQGKIMVEVDGKKISPGVLSSCEDLDCQQLFWNITAPPLSTSGSSSLLTTWPVGWLIPFLVVMALLREEF